MINAVKFARLLLLPLLLFMANNSNVNFVVANGTPKSQLQQLQQQQPLPQQEVFYAPQQLQQLPQRQNEWYHQQLQQLQQYQQQATQLQKQQPYNPALPAIPLSAPTTATGAVHQQPPAAATSPSPSSSSLAADTLTAAENFTTSTQPNGVGYASDTVGYIEDTPSGEDADDKQPSEIQKAVCTVTAGEVRASAEAVTTKKLKGVCGSAELKLAFSDLEAKLYKELQEIKTLLQYIAQQQGINAPQLLRPMSPPIATTTPLTPLVAATPTKPPPPTTQVAATRLVQHKQLPSSKPTTVAKPLFQPIAEPKSNALDTSAEASYEYEESSAGIEAEDPLPKKLPQLKSVHPKSQSASVPSELLQEIRKFNNTMLSDSELKVFTYYWKLENFTARIESGHSTLVESPIFSIKGKPLHLVADFQHLNRDFLYLQLTQAKTRTKSTFKGFNFARALQSRQRVSHTE
ncbi:unnamed protein product [Ceratitis capitata]|uniref:(Mediterranean fruit fly) hypothetical protein n=1 Tax=Ceratitis capitata TaxID=7213 RepID=A0A811V4G0_CERCA|nr:unnamed protein product [Ceratitis capitata]